MNYSIIILLLFYLASCSKDATKKYIGTYLGQTPPGEEAMLFCSGFISTEMHEHSMLSFSPDLTTVLWNAQFLDDGAGFPNRVIISEMHDNGWSTPDYFDGIKLSNAGGACYNSDGSRIYFSSRTDAQGFGKNNFNIWYIEKNGSAWGSPKTLSSPINSPALEAQATLSRNNNIYFLKETDTETHRYEIYRSEYSNGTYSQPAPLPPSINSVYVDWTPFIAADESYLLFSSNRDEHNGDIYISFRSPDGKWSAPKNLGPTVNHPNAQERYPSVSPDGRYLFFVSNRLNKEIEDESAQSLIQYRRLMAKPGNSWNDFYWVDAQLIEKFRPSN